MRSEATMLTVATANVNGIRAAFRRGMPAWLAERSPDILCLQEVRASDEVLEDLLSDLLGDPLTGVHEESSSKGRAGVAVLAGFAPTDVRRSLPGAAAAEFAGTGRWVEADYLLGRPEGLADVEITVVSVYAHTGEAETPRQDEKYRFFDAVLLRLAELAETGRNILVCGDLNIAHREVDIKNWKGNLTRAGFLPKERALLERLFTEEGYVDVHRTLAGDGQGPYTWWSWRGKAFDNDAGWRIDYQIASPALAAAAVKAEVDRAATYAERWSDHAALVVDYDLTRL